MKTRNDFEIACDCVKRANVVLHVGLCEEIFARKHTATHKPTSAQPLYSYQRDIHTRINRLWSPLAYGLGGKKLLLSNVNRIGRYSRRPLTAICIEAPSLISISNFSSDFVLFFLPVFVFNTSSVLTSSSKINYLLANFLQIWDVITLALGHI